MSTLNSPTSTDGEQTKKAELSTITSIEYVLNGIRIDDKAFGALDWYALVMKVKGLYDPHLKYFHFSPPAKCLQFGFLRPHVYSWLLEPGPEAFLINGIVFDCAHWRVFALASLPVESKLPESVASASQRVVQSAASGNKIIRECCLLQKFLLVDQDGKWLALYRTIEKFIDPASSGKNKVNDRIIDFQVFPMDDHQLLEAFDYANCRNLALAIVGSFQEHAGAAVQSKKDAAEGIERKIRLAEEILGRIA